MIRSRLVGNNLLKDGVLLMSAAIGSHICNIIFQMVMGRMLSGLEYALLCTLLGVVNIAVLPLGAIGTAINHSTSVLVQEGREGDVARLVRKWLLRMGGAGIFILSVCLAFSNQIASFMHLDRRAPVIIMGLIFLLIFSSAVVGGATNGLQMFGVATAGLQFSSAIRVIAGALLLLTVVRAAGWGLMGHAVGLSTNLAVLFVFLWFRLHGKQKTADAVPSIRSYVVYSFITLMAFAVLLRADMIFVKHYLPSEAEVFAYATTIGHIVIFLPMPLAVAMFPKVVSTSSVTNSAHAMILRKSLFYTIICVLPAAVGCSLWGWIPLRIMYGIVDPSSELLYLISVMGWVMAPVALINVIVNFLLAQRRFRQTLPVFLSALFYTVAVHLKHDTIWEVVAIAGISTWGCLIANSLVAFKGFGRSQDVRFGQSRA